MLQRIVRITIGGFVAAVAFFILGATAHANDLPADPACQITTYSYSINGWAAPLSSIKPGDHVVVSFTVPAGCTDQLSFASYRTPQHWFDPNTADQQVLVSSATGTFGPGVHTLAIDVFAGGGTGGNPADCSVSHNSDTGHGANHSGPYDSTCDGSASQNGKGGGAATGKPCAGCVGNADDKNPKGQYPNGTDHNAGYECDRNQGVGQTNPAHTGCQGIQVDFAYGPVKPKLGGANGFYNDGGGLIDSFNA